MIEVSGLVKRFGRHVAVGGLTFSAPDGAITGLLGANGAGKTTTLGIVAGVMQADSGSVQVDGIPVEADAVEPRARLGVLLDQRGIYSRLTVRENIAYFGRLHALDSVELRSAVADVIDLVGLGRLADRRSAGLSEGERMKVALGRALVHHPSNLLLDEPTNGLDVPSVRGLRDLLRRLRDQGRAILFSSHVLDEVRQLCDHVVVIADGRLVAQGTAEQVCRTAGASSLEDAFVALSSGAEAGA